MRMQMNKMMAIAAVIFAAAGACLADVNLYEGLVAYFPFDGNCLDESGNNHDLSNSGDFALVEGAHGESNGAFRFVGTGALLADGDAEVLEGTFSFSIRFKTTAQLSSHGTSGTAWNPGNYVIFPHHGGSNAGVGVKVGCDGIQVCEHGSCYLPTVLSYSGAIDSGWHQIVVTVENNGAPILYLDGSYLATGSQSGRTKYFGVKDVGGGGWGYYTGDADDFTVWNRVLDEGEIAALYNADGLITDRPIVSRPIIAVAETQTDDPQAVTIRCDTEGSSIFYSVDGGENYSLYTAPFTVQGNVTISAYATKDGYYNSSRSTLVVRQVWATQVKTAFFDTAKSSAKFDSEIGKEWILDNSVKSDSGVGSMRSYPIGASQSTYMSMTVNGPGTLSFWWKVSSESNYDYLRYFVDDTQGGQISGTVDWTQVTIELEGESDHTIKWQYSKDGSVDSGSDCGWIDCVEWSGEPEVSEPTVLTITFDSCGGNSVTSQYVNIEAPIGTMQTPERSGYVFMGWFTAADDGVEVTSETAFTENVTLYAHWAKEGDVVIISANVRDDDATVLDVAYRVTTTNATANVRALAFEDGEESFAKIVRPETFIDGTGGNLGYSVPANTNLTLSWKVTDDWDVKLARVKFMVLVEENCYPIPLDLVTIPANGSNKAATFSTNEISSETFRDALFWLYANYDSGLVLENGILSAGGVILANGAELAHPEAERYVFKSMDYQLLDGDSLQYVNETARLNLNPEGNKQHAFRQD